MKDDEIVRKYSDMVYRIALQYLANIHNAQDVFSEVFLTYFKKKRAFNDEEHRKAWFIKVTINACKDFYLSPEYKNTVHGDDCLLTASCFDNQEEFEIFDIVSKLKPDYSQVIYLFYYEDMTIKEIAVLLDMNENTVKTNLSRAKAAIKKELEAI